MHPVERKTALVLVLAGILVVGLSGLWYGNASEAARASRLVDHTYEVLTELKATSSAVSDLQSSARKYLVTGGPGVPNLTPTEVNRHLQRLAQLTADNPRQQANLEALRGAISRRLEILHTSVELRQKSSLEVLREFLQRNTGEAAMESVRNDIGVMQDEEERLLQQREMAEKNSRRNSTIIFVVFVALEFALLLLTYEVIRRNEASQRKAESALRESEERYRALFNDSPFPMWTFDEGTLRIVDANNAAVRHYGYSSEEFRSLTLQELHPGDQPGHLRGALGQEKGGSVTQHRRQDGEIFDVEVHSHGIPYAGKSLGLKVAVDVTERLRAERQIQEQNLALQLSRKEAERANQMKSQFLASMSHELRTPLNSILGFSELLEDEGPGPLNEKQRRYVGHIRSAGRHLLELINDILDLSKIEAGQLEMHVEDFGLTSALPEVLALVRPLAMKKRQPLTLIPEQDHAVRADRVRFKQIVYNLLSNAVKFTPEGGEIRVEAARDGDFVRVTVVDTGIGIAGEDLGVIFDEFRQVGDTTKGIKEGTGLGLAITKRLVEQQGGTIRAESEPGKGSRFIFTLPASMAAVSPEPAPVRAAVPAARRRQPLVLVVDDEPPARELLSSYLVPNGFTVATAESSRQALDRARALQPDAITLNMLLPGKSGWETLSDLKNDAATKDIPVIVVSIVDNKKMGFALGASEYLVKPVDKETLLGALRKFVRPVETARVLVADDDPGTLRFVDEILAAAGYGTVLVSNGHEALLALGRERVAAILLDLLMPGMDGFEVLRAVKQSDQWRNIPVLVLTAKDLTESETEQLDRDTRAWFRKAGLRKDQLLEELRLATRPRDSGRAGTP